MFAWITLVPGEAPATPSLRGAAVVVHDPSVSPTLALVQAEVSVLILPLMRAASQLQLEVLPLLSASPFLFAAPPGFGAVPRRGDAGRRHVQLSAECAYARPEQLQELPCGSTLSSAHRLRSRRAVSSLGLTIGSSASSSWRVEGQAMTLPCFPSSAIAIMTTPYEGSKKMERVDGKLGKSFGR